MNYTEMIAKGLKLHCEHFEYDKIEKLKENCSVQNFHELFCKVTDTYFINDGDGYYASGKDVKYYDVTFNQKEGIATVKRCGPDWDYRDIDATVKTEDVVKLLVQDESEEKDNEMG